VNAGFESRAEVGPEAAGRTVLAWLARRYRHSTEAAWRERIASGEVRLDGEVVLAMAVLRPGQTLVWRRPPWEEPAVPLGFAILHRDDHLLAVAKPRGLPSVPNGGFLAERLRNRSKVPDLRLHDLRRTVASLMTGMGISRLTVKKILSHAARDVTAVYDRHSYDPEKPQA